MGGRITIAYINEIPLVSLIRDLIPLQELAISIINKIHNEIVKENINH